MVAGTKDGIMMVEAGANEVTEEQIAEAMEFAHKAMQPAIELQQELVKKVGVTSRNMNLTCRTKRSRKRLISGWKASWAKICASRIRSATTWWPDLRDEMHDAFRRRTGRRRIRRLQGDYDEAFQLAVHKDVRKGIVEDSVRPDGRKLTEIRPLSSEVGLLPRAHGSSLFTRGMTQALNIVTLAPLSYAQMVDTMEQRRRAPLHAPLQRARLHRRRSPAPGQPGPPRNRPRLPGGAGPDGRFADRSRFPYTIRSVTEIMSQNGSTSMAATCSSCLALMDAGVPLKAPVSGIAMGLMMDGDKPYILSDIADAEDFAGDMDFKVAGTAKGITALQMDMKVHGLPVDSAEAGAGAGQRWPGAHPGAHADHYCRSRAKR